MQTKIDQQILDIELLKESQRKVGEMHLLEMAKINEKKR